MEKLRKSPGPAAAYAFRLGMYAGAIIGLAAIGALFFVGALSLVLLGYALVLLFPVYLVIVATVLSVWLGYDQDAASLRPVYVPKK